MKAETPQTIHLKDYKPPVFWIDTIDLCFWLDESKTRVRSTLKLRKNQDNPAKELFLNGEELQFISLKRDGQPLVEGEDFVLEEEGMRLYKMPESCVLEIENFINPEANKALDGLYKSGTIFCTQNEPEGFRRITYYIDRPDVMAKFTTKIIAKKDRYPVLLSNGNPIDSGDLEDGLHFMTWEDPYLKPCYLYALVAGDLGLVQDEFITRSGRKVDLRIYCDKGNESKCDHAMKSLINSMKWDEERFGLEYDLDIYMIVAVDSFNMGAMENKGLNIFNSAYVLADTKTATDQNFMGIESVIGHEYFHNWTGNRITCRDWFQLTLKEGLTVFRDQEFSADLNSRPVQRIQDVSSLRGRQFVEDAGPTSHPIKPDSYMEINNFYSATVYEKGAEVIRMIHTFLGEKGFRKGMDKYFELFDGQAVTTEDFIHAMSVANDNFDFSQFKRWYSQAGTPELKVDYTQNLRDKTVTLNIVQKTKPTPGQAVKNPFHMPFIIGLVGENGEDIGFTKTGGNHQELSRGLIHIKEESQIFILEGVDQKIVPSLNRGFSAPVNLKTNLTTQDYLFLMAHDSDAFNRYEAAQVLMIQIMEELLENEKKSEELKLNQDFSEAFGKILKDPSLDPATKALMITLPAAGTLHQRQEVLAIDETAKVRSWLKAQLASSHEAAFLSLYKELNVEAEYKLDPHSIGQRDLKNLVLDYLVAMKKPEVYDLAFSQFSAATNMTDEINALAALISSSAPKASDAISAFYKKWKHETLVMQKWLATQVVNAGDDVFQKIIELEADPIYDKTVPNLVRSIYRSFLSNHKQFHEKTGKGYQLVIDRVLELDSLNPQLAAGMCQGFGVFKKLDQQRADLMRFHLERVIAQEKISKNTFEVVSKILA